MIVLVIYHWLCDNLQGCPVMLGTVHHVVGKILNG